MRRIPTSPRSRSGTGARRPPTVPLVLLQAAGLLAEAVFLPLGKEPPLSRRTLRFFTGNTAFDIGKARRRLDYQPRYDLVAGLSETQAILGAAEPWSLPLPRPAAS